MTWYSYITTQLKKIYQFDIIEGSVSGILQTLMSSTLPLIHPSNIRHNMVLIIFNDKVICGISNMILKEKEKLGYLRLSTNMFNKVI